jgi:transcriptional regulator with XRE-family HTH domain
VLKGLRQAKGLSQVALAKAAKVERTYLVKLESGDKKNPSLDVLKRLARALGVPVTELLE